MTKTVKPLFNNQTRENWGYWDGIAARKWNKHPQWAKSWQTRPAHPCDKHYGIGFWKGWYGETPHVSACT